MTKVTIGGLKGYPGGKMIRRLKTPPAYGLSTGPMIVASHVFRSCSVIGPAEQFAGGDSMISFSSEAIRLFIVNDVNCNKAVVLYCLSGKTSKFISSSLSLFRR